MNRDEDRRIKNIFKFMEQNDLTPLGGANGVKNYNKKSFIFRMIFVFLIIVAFFVVIFVFINIILRNKTANRSQSNTGFSKNINIQKPDDKTVFIENGRHFREYGMAYKTVAGNIFYPAYADVGGRLAYVAIKNNEGVVVLDNKEFGRGLGSIPLNIVDAGGEPAYLVLINSETEALNLLGNIYIGEKRVDTRYKFSTNLIEYNGKIAYLGFRSFRPTQGYDIEGLVVNYDGREYGLQYNGDISELFILDGKLSFLARVKVDEDTAAPGVVQIIDGKEVELTQERYTGLDVRNSNNQPEYLTQEGRAYRDYIRDIAMINTKPAIVRYVSKEAEFVSPKERYYAFYGGHHYGLELDDVLEVASVNNEIAILGIKNGKRIIGYNKKWYGAHYDYLYDLPEWKNSADERALRIQSGEDALRVNNLGIYNIGEVAGKLTYQVKLIEKDIIVMEE